MFRDSVSRSWPGSRLLGLAAAAGLGLVLGAVSLLASPQVALAALVVLATALAVLKRPEIALLVILACTSSILFTEKLPLIPIGVGSLHIPDICLLATLGLILVRGLVERGFRFRPTPLDRAVLAFCGLSLLATVWGVARSYVDVRSAIQAARPVAYYLAFFVVTQLVRQEHQVRLLVRGMFVLAVVVAVTMVAQSLLGESASLLPGRVENLVTQGQAYEDVTRIVTPGRSLLLVMLIVVSAVMVLKGQHAAGPLLLVGWVLLGVGLGLTFLRSFWLVALLALVLLWFLVPRENRFRLQILGLLVLLVAALAILPFLGDNDSKIMKTMSAALARLETMGSSETLHERSLEWRGMENRHALRSIAAHPFLGLGLGARYRPWDPVFDLSTDASEYDLRTHIHNGHLAILVRSGLFGYLAFAWLSAAFLWRGFRAWRSVADAELRGVVLGFTLAYLAVVASAVVNSTFHNWFWTPVLAIMLAVNEVIIGSQAQPGRELDIDLSQAKETRP